MVKFKCQIESGRVIRSDQPDLFLTVTKDDLCLSTPEGGPGFGLKSFCSCFLIEPMRYHFLIESLKQQAAGNDGKGAGPADCGGG